MLEERARIARELHDTVAQTLYAITLGAARARCLLQRNDASEVQRIIEDVLELATAGQAEVRALLSDIRSEQPDAGGLAAALAKLSADVQKRNCLDIRLSLAAEQNLPAATKDALLMIAREALHNVVRHSGAGRVDVVLERDRDELLLLMTDDGRGFDIAAPRPGHFGLVSMRERASAVGGTFALISAVGRGTQVRVAIPTRRVTDG